MALLIHYALNPARVLLLVVYDATGWKFSDRVAVNVDQICHGLLYVQQASRM